MKVTCEDFELKSHIDEIKNKNWLICNSNTNTYIRCFRFKMEDIKFKSVCTRFQTGTVWRGIVCFHPGMNFFRVSFFPVILFLLNRIS